MPFVFARKIPCVTHVGHFEPLAERLKPGLEGPGFVVSDDPDRLRVATGLNGPDTFLHCPTAEWLDALSFEEKDHRELRIWMLHEQNRYLEPVTTYQVLVEDEDTGDLVERIFLSLKEAAASTLR